MAVRAQLLLWLPTKGRRGVRKGAGRKRRAERPMVPHQTREEFKPGEPQHVTVRLRKGLPSRRRKKAVRTLRLAFLAAQERTGMRVVHWSVQANHLHLIVESRDRVALSRGMQGLKIRMARALNRLWNRSGAVFSDRYHARILRSPRQVRNALLYVLNNFRRHQAQRGRRLPASFVDPLSTTSGFDGWRQRPPCPVAKLATPPPKTWLLRVGWRRAGLLEPCMVPG
ncbi:MAG: transposase [Myxococcota bacterium]